MKPSQQIERIVDNLRKVNPFAYPYDNDLSIALTHISAIQQYLDEEYDWEVEKSKTEIIIKEDIQ